MFDNLLARLSLRRSAAGIYYELRTLRQMAEILFESQGVELPRERRRKSKAGDADSIELDVDPPNEEQLAAAEEERIRREVYAGRDPKNPWRPDPNR